MRMQPVPGTFVDLYGAGINAGALSNNMDQFGVNSLLGSWRDYLDRKLARWQIHKQEKIARKNREMGAITSLGSSILAPQGIAQSSIGAALYKNPLDALRTNTDAEIFAKMDPESLALQDLPPSKPITNQLTFPNAPMFDPATVGGPTMASLYWLPYGVGGIPAIPVMY